MNVSFVTLYAVLRYMHALRNLQPTCVAATDCRLCYSVGEVNGDKITMYIRVTLYWRYLIVLWLFYLVCILYCGCLNLFC